MGEANAISDLERAEHLAYADSKGVKRVSLFNDGVQINAATEEKQDALAGYAKAGQDISGDPMYFAGLKADGKWYIKKMYLSGDYTSKYANGTSGFDWSVRASLSYVDFDDLTW